eukprot:1920814-Amphidinium_carterae.1
MLKDAQLTVLSALAVNVCSKVPVAAPVLQSIFNQHLRQHLSFAVALLALIAALCLVVRRKERT